MTHRPHWGNHCKHPPKSFVGTIRDTHEHEFVDVYVYQNKTTPEFKICLRYGEQEDQYLSPLSLHMRD